ncbi:MAG: acyl-CoA/acyl-ACP dehydrogenase [Anaerolineae bacterium]|nr:acyl-CoA/acyl-ACP dehydrogenase [Anaerolineae bacterium]
MNVTKERKYDQHQNGRPNLWLELIAQMGDQLSACEQQSDETDAFVSANYALLREHRFFAALVPAEFGGSGVDYGDMSDILRVMAHYSPSTALAHSMHQHLVAANVFKHKKGQDVRGFLQKVADQQPVLISTGARDWLESNGTMTRTEGGYLFSAVKQFGSQSAEGGIAVTSAPYEDEQGDWHVLHFPVPLASDGVSLIENWEALGMRGTGSHAIKFEDVFVPDAAIALSRPRGTYHGVWNVVLTVAMPLIMSVYVGIAQKAAQIATDHVRQFPAPKPHQISAVGALNNELSIAEMALNDMLRINNNFDFTPTDACGHLILTRKSIIADAVIEVVNQAMDIVGGQAFYRRHPLEKLLRDVQGARYHPIYKADQHLFSGNYLLRA